MLARLEGKTKKKKNQKTQSESKMEKNNSLIKQTKVHT